MARYGLAVCLVHAGQSDDALAQLGMIPDGGGFAFEADARMLEGQLLYAAAEFEQASERVEAQCDLSNKHSKRVACKGVFPFVKQHGLQLRIIQKLHDLPVDFDHRSEQSTGTSRSSGILNDSDTVREIGEGWGGTANFLYSLRQRLRITGEKHGARRQANELMGEAGDQDNK